MNMSKLVKRSNVIVAEKAYEVPVSRNKYEQEQLQEDMVRELEQDKPVAEIKSRPVREDIIGETLIKKLGEIIADNNNQAQDMAGSLMSEEIIAQAKRTAELIVKHTLESAKFELTNVIAQGYADGFAEGKSEARSVIEPALGKLALLNEAAASVQDIMLADFKDGMFAIISEISSKIVHREISSGDEYLLELYKDALKSIKAEEFVTVTVSESQIDFAVRNADLFKEAVSHVQDFKIVPEKDAGRGTMIVETARSMADASYYVQEEKIDLILEQLRDTLVIPQSAQEIEELEKIKSMREENLDYLNSLNNNLDYNDSSELNFDLENFNFENQENLSDI